MTVDAKTRVTEIVAGLSGASRQGAAAADELLPVVYDELRRLARHFMSRERRDHTLQPTALVHEAYLKLVDQTRVDWRGRTHFFALGAMAMRRILIDHARGHGRERRGAGQQRVTLAEKVAPSSESDLDLEELLSLNGALERLAQYDERQARIVELRFFGGLTVDEAAHVLGVSERTIASDWAHARAWLRRELDRGEAR